MKKMMYLVLLFVAAGITAQIQTRDYGNGAFDAYDERPQEYIILRTPLLIDGKTGDIVKNENLLPGTIFYPSFYGRIWVDSLEYDKGRVDVVNYRDDTDTIYISTDDISIAHSRIFPDTILTKKNRAFEYYWLPSYTIDIVESRERDTIFMYEPGRPKDYQVEDEIFPWYANTPYPVIVEISNTDITVSGGNLSVYSLIQKIDYTNSFYTLYLSKAKEKWYSKEKIEGFSYCANMPDIKSPKPAVLLLELNAANNRMRVYNGETKRIIFDLIKVSTDFYDKYIEFIQTDAVPKALVIPPELLAGWPGDVEISPLYVEGEKLSYAALRDTALYAMPGAASDTIAELPAGSRLTPLEPGLTDTVGLLTGPWLYAKTEDGAEGWCFSGDLEASKKLPVFGDDTPTYTAVSNLRLREKPTADANVLAGISEKSGMKILEQGPEETIDGITAPWVKVLLKDGKQGWCFSGYLEALPQPAKEIPRAPAPLPRPAAEEEKAAQSETREAASGPANEGSGVSPALFGVLGAALVAAGAGFVFLRRKKKKET
jgi:LPXTG-motif cell wall-anchored protein